MNRTSWSAVGLAALKLLALLAGYLTVLIVLALLWVFGAGVDNYPASLNSAMEPLQIMSGIVFTGCLIVFYRRKKLSFKEAAGLKRTNFSLPKLALFAVYGVLLNSFFVILLNLLPAAGTASYGISVSEALLGGDFRLACLIILFYAPLTEEIFFRGLAFTYLKGCLRPYHAAIVLSVVFGLAHAQPLWVAYAMLMGMVFSCITIRVGSIVPAVITHVFFNATSLALFVTSLRLRADWPFGLPLEVVWLLLAAIAALSVLLTIKLYHLTGRKHAHAA